MSVTAFLLNERRFEPRLWLTTEGLVDLKDIKAIIDLMKKNSISEFELERQDFKIKLKRGANGVLQPAQGEDSHMVAYMPAPLALPSGAAHAAVPLPAANSSEVEGKSP